MKTKFTLVLMAVTAFITAQAQWQPVASNTTQNLHSVSFSGNNGVVSGSNGRILYSADAGVTWDDSAYSPFLVNGSVAYATANRVVVGSSGRYYISNNGGVSFETPVSQTGFGDFQDIVFTSATNGVAISDYCRIATTTDGGSTWTNGANPCGNSSEMRDLSFPTAQVGYYCGANGNVAKTTDGGTSWLPVTPPGKSNTDYYTIQFFDADNGFVAGRKSANLDTFVFKKTTDGGATWIDMAGPLLTAGVGRSQVVTTFRFANNGQLGYIANESVGKIYKTTDGGNTWALDYTHSSTPNFNNIYIGNGFAMIAGSQGLLLRTNLGSVGIAGTPAHELLNIYPNPAKDILYIANAGSYVNAEIIITDISGKQVMYEKTDRNLVNVAGLANGFYVLQVKADGRINQQKFVIQR